MGGKSEVEKPVERVRIGDPIRQRCREAQKADLYWSAQAWSTFLGYLVSLGVQSFERQLTQQKKENDGLPSSRPETPPGQKMASQG